MSLLTQIVSAPKRRATGAIDAGSRVLDCARSSSAYSRSIAPGDPSGSRSRVINGLSVRPGSGRIDRVAPTERAELGTRQAA